MLPNQQIDEILTKIRTTESINSLTNELKQNSELRTELSELVDVWKSLIPLDSRPKLLFANNLSATPKSGPPSFESGFLNHLFTLEFSRIHWQIAANLSQSLIALPDLTVNLVTQVSNAIESEDSRKACLFFIKNSAGKINNLDLIIPCLKTAKIDDELVSAVRSLYLSNHLVVDDEYRLVNVVLESIDPKFWEPNSEGGPKSEGDTGIKLALQIVDEIRQSPIVEYFNNRNSDSGQFHWRKTLMLLESLNSVLLYPQSKIVHDAIINLCPELIELLKQSKNLPARNKFSPEDLSEFDFPYLRTALLSVLSGIALVSESVRDVFRETGGLAAILDCCVIDSNNPFMKERAVVCLRYLMANNPKNQEFVSQLQRIERT